MRTAADFGVGIICALLLSLPSVGLSAETLPGTRKLTPASAMDRDEREIERLQNAAKSAQKNNEYDRAR